MSKYKRIVAGYLCAHGLLFGVEDTVKNNKDIQQLNQFEEYVNNKNKQLDGYAHTVVDRTIINIKTIEFIEYPKTQTFIETVQNFFDGRFKNRFMGTSLVSVQDIPQEVRGDVLKKASQFLLQKIVDSSASQDDQKIFSYAFAHVEMERKAFVNQSKAALATIIGSSLIVGGGIVYLCFDPHAIAQEAARVATQLVASQSK